VREIVTGLAAGGGHAGQVSGQKDANLHCLGGYTDISRSVFHRMNTPMSPLRRKSCSRVGSTIFGSHFRMLKVTQTGLYPCNLSEGLLCVFLPRNLSHGLHNGGSGCWHAWSRRTARYRHKKRNVAPRMSYKLYGTKPHFFVKYYQNLWCRSSAVFRKVCVNLISEKIG
jgi:hypothetical protein